MLKQLINNIKNIVLSSPIYNDFAEGHISERASHTGYTYPLVWLDAEQNSHIIDQNNAIFNFDIYFCDLVFKDRSNELEIKSDTFDSAIDFVRYMVENGDTIGVNVTDIVYNIDTFAYNFNTDLVAGNKLNIQFMMVVDSTVCENIF